MKNPKTPFRMMVNSTDRLEVRFEKDQLKGLSGKQSTVSRLEVIQAGKLGYARSTKRDFENLFTKAVESSVYGDKMGYKYPKIQNPKSKIQTYSSKVKAMGTKQLVELGRYIIEQIKAVNPKILVDLSIETQEFEQLLTNSQGLDNKQTGTMFSLSATGELVTPGDILQIGDYFSWGDDSFDKKSFSAGIKNKFLLAKKLVKAKSDKTRVIFSPEVVATLIEFLETAISAESFYKKVSFWQKSLGKKVTDSRFNLLDDPRIDFAGGSTIYDDEGLVCQRLALIEKGVLKNIVTDLKYASRLKIKPVGRGFGIPAQPSLTNLIVETGEKSFDQLISQTQNGVWVDQIIGGGQDNPYAGNFSFSANLGYLIEGGEVKGRVKDLMVSGNIFELLLNQLAEVSSSFVWYDGHMKLPYLSFEGVTITAK